METTLTSASHSFSARSPMMSNTGLASVGERLMTVSISLVAVWYSSNSWRSSRARLHLVEQPRVLDGDHRLGGEGL